MPTWILGPDPNKNCCGCSSRQGPCDSCCPVDTVPQEDILISPLFPSGTIFFYNQSYGSVSKDDINGIVVGGNGPFDPGLAQQPQIRFQLPIASGYYIKINANTESNQFNSSTPLTCLNSEKNNRVGSFATLSFTNGTSGLFTNIPAPSINNTIVATIHSLDCLCSEIGEYDYTVTYINGAWVGGNPRHDFDQPLYDRETVANSMIITGTNALALSVNSWGNLNYDYDCPITFSNSSFCIDLACSAHCSPPQTYSFNPSQLSAPDAPLVNLSQTSQLINTQLNGTGVSMVCGEVSLVGNCAFYLYDKNMTPINITGLLLKFNTYSPP